MSRAYGIRLDFTSTFLAQKNYCQQNFCRIFKNILLQEAHILLLILYYNANGVLFSILIIFYSLLSRINGKKFIHFNHKQQFRNKFIQCFKHTRYKHTLACFIQSFWYYFSIIWNNSFSNIAFDRLQIFKESLRSWQSNVINMLNYYVCVLFGDLDRQI